MVWVEILSPGLTVFFILITPLILRKSLDKSKGFR